MCIVYRQNSVLIARFYLQGKVCNLDLEAATDVGCGGALRTDVLLPELKTNAIVIISAYKQKRIDVFVRILLVVIDSM